MSRVPQTLPVYQRRDHINSSDSNLIGFDRTCSCIISPPYESHCLISKLLGMSFVSLGPSQPGTIYSASTMSSCPTVAFFTYLLNPLTMITVPDALHDNFDTLTKSSTYPRRVLGTPEVQSLGSLVI